MSPSARRHDKASPTRHIRKKGTLGRALKIGDKKYHFVIHSNFITIALKKQLRYDIHYASVAVMRCFIVPLGAATAPLSAFEGCRHTATAPLSLCSRVAI